ncbi:hypothetical protein QR680_017100 [Steinernema hermaphroditum]|uniref:Sodium/hydrogen exchanger n=1 Tax=Steinernema hermaphroditum TaxID=289476 RepID=A0AA39LNQ5_9BILA|nr:hypothetical protein QR680_017100 [Steinernema hermaphroditum]
MLQPWEKIFLFQWHNVHTPLFFSAILLIIMVCKLGFHSSARLSKIFPESALLIALGLGTGLALIYLLQVPYVYLHPDLFFLYLLPPIVLEAGFCLPNKDFFNNIFTISLFALVGTLWNIVSIGCVLYLFRGFFEVEKTFLDLMLFSTIISAVDPVAVLSVFEEIHVNKLLYICVFGESLLNDAVTVALYHTFSSMLKIGSENLETSDFAMAVVSFGLVAFGGIIIGIVGGFLTSLITRFTSKVHVVETLLCLICPYLVYCIAEAVHMSGILGIVCCGVLMKPYISGNISHKSLITVKYLLKGLSASCEALIFAFLGLSTVRAFSDGKKWDLSFAAITVVACFVCRFIGVFLLSALANPWRIEKINKVDQFIMGYGGLRGAVCYGLVMSVDSESEPLKEVFVTTTVIVIVLSVFLQGTTMKPIVECLRVKKVEEKKGTVAQLIMHNIEDHMMAGIEGVIGHHGHFWVRRKLTQIDSNVFAPVLMRNPPSRTTKLLNKYEEESVAEARSYLKKHGSFAGLEASKGHPLYTRESRASTLQGEKGDIERNESLSRILERNLPASPRRKNSKHIYNRTTLGSEDDLRKLRSQIPVYNRRPPASTPLAPLLTQTVEAAESSESTPEPDSACGEHIRFFLDSNDLRTEGVREGRATSVVEVVDETKKLQPIVESDEKETA